MENTSEENDELYYKGLYRSPHKKDYNVLDYFQVLPFYSSVPNTKKVIYRAKSKAKYDFFEMDVCTNIAMLNPYQKTFQRRQKLYNKLLAILMDYICFRLVHSKNIIKFKIFKIVFDRSDGIMKIRKPSRAHFTPLERKKATMVRLRTPYVKHRVIQEYEFSRSRMEAKKAIKELDLQVKAQPRTIHRKRLIKKNIL